MHKTRMWKMTIDVDEGKKAEEQSRFLAQLQASLNVIPAYTWYAAPSGGLTFVNKRTADYLGLRKIIRYVWASTLARSGTPISRCCIRTIKKSHANPGQAVCARRSSLRRAFEFVTLKEATAGSAVASNRSGRAMEPCCCGSG